MHNVFADTCVSVTDLKRNYTKILHESQDKARAVAVLNHNRPEAYLLPAALYERLLNLVDDAKDASLVRERGNGPFIEVSLNEL